MAWFKKDKEEVGAAPNTHEEQTFLHDIVIKQDEAQNNRLEIEKVWEDEYKCFIGKQWELSIAPRKKDGKEKHPNPVDNFVFPAVLGMVNTITATTPELTLEVSDGDNETDDTELEKKVNDVVANVLEKNKFPALWKKMVLGMVQHGPIIGTVLWDNDWVGGVGPNRWVGEVRIIAQKKEEIYFDPAIIDLEERLQECSFINRKFRKKLQYFKDRWEYGKYVQAENNEDDQEPANHGQAWLIEHWHRGKPKFIPESRKKELMQKYHDYMPPSVTVDEFKAEKYRQMAEGKINGVHVAYATRDVFLEYVPYAYEDGLYPFVYKVLYHDAKCPYGFGEIRNAMNPQVMHNKADEIELEGMSVEGLGGGMYQKNAITAKQLNYIKDNWHKGGVWAEVDNVNLIKPRDGVRVPATIPNYKEHKQRMVETITKNTPIRQGMAPGANMPYAAIAELGARTDTATKGIVEILEDFLKEMAQLVVNRIKEFYTEERVYKVREEKNGIDMSLLNQLKQIAQMPPSPDKYIAIENLMQSLKTPTKQRFSTFSNQDLTRQWERESAGYDLEGNPIEPKMETYMPDFTAKVKVIDERPTDRNYYVTLAKELYNAGKLDDETFWYVIEEGKFPPKEIVLERLQRMKQEAMMVQQPVMMGGVQGGTMPTV
jgi:hypothetical protein